MKNELRKWKKNSLALAGLGLAALVAGCGSAKDPVTVAPTQAAQNAVPQATPGIAFPTVTCPAGTYSVNGGVCLPRFEDSCTSAFGKVISVAGKSYCQTSRNAHYIFGSKVLPVYGSIYRLSPQTPNGPSPATVEPVRKNDAVSITAVSGGWGGTDSDYPSIFGSDLTDFSCDIVKADGTAQGLNSSYQSQPAGLMASDGKEVFYVGNGLATPKVIQNDGILVVGYNAPTNIGHCMSLSFDLKITRCEDGQGGTVACN